MDTSHVLRENGASLLRTVSGGLAACQNCFILILISESAKVVFLKLSRFNFFFFFLPINLGTGNTFFNWYRVSQSVSECVSV